MDDGTTALHKAVLNDSQIIVENLIEREAPVGNYIDYHGNARSPLRDAINRKEDAISCLLLVSGAPLNDAAGGLYDSQELLAASFNMGLVDTCNMLVERGASFSSLSRKQKQAAIRAAIGWCTKGDGECGIGLLKVISEDGWKPTSDETKAVLDVVSDNQKRITDKSKERIMGLITTWRMDYTQTKKVAHNNGKFRR